ncbi:subtilisin-like protein protease SBT3.3 [Cinnamomum micranthum f. kanehirae]|uniref:Subtilisin-like protein protease SBT3.3 n=1 Tax=Cinnamomum micranthum f. kanehirae TaxID=337451 RepID=A0A3S3Q7M6_9MAGN|nr:subtilisin-like protein protease SBT3.3 [Cinnamomum micranthum f. kanehirae]
MHLRRVLEQRHAMASLSPISALQLLLVFFICFRHLPNTFVAAKSKVHIVYMGERQHSDPSVVEDSHHRMLADLLGSKEAVAGSILYSYKHGFSGFAAWLTDSQAEMIADYPGVVDVIPNSLMKPQTTHSWDYLGLSYSQGAPNLLSESNMGDGTTIGVIDSGIWPESESFNDEGLGPIPSHWKGTCEPGTNFTSANCNRKLIGARWFIKGLLAALGGPYNATAHSDYLSARDFSGHGSHCSSIAAGSLLKNLSYKGLASGTARGGAPRARLAMYKICWNTLDGLCSTVDMLQAIDQAIYDGVNVLSISISWILPYFYDAGERDTIAIGAFHAVARGITVVCAAGNGGPRPNTLGNTAPWILTVGASTIDRSYPTAITLGNNRTIVGQGLYTGQEVGFAPLVSLQEAGVYGVLASLCTYLPTNDTLMAGKVVLCFASTSGSTQNTSLNASSVVKAAGGLGVIVARNPSHVSLCDDFPCIEVDFNIGIQILTYIRASRSPMVKLSPTKTLVGKPLTGKVAYLSGRGPGPWTPAILKPDVVAPGINILAATIPSDSPLYNGYTFKSGTSMATPHVAGIAALLKALHPDWSPAAIKSALITTASTTDEFGDPILAVGEPNNPATPFDYGGGIVNPNQAADPGLIYDMGLTDYVNYLCSMGYNNSAISKLTEKPSVCPSKRPSILNINYPAITIPNLRTSVTATRTVTNVGPVNAVYNASIECPHGVKVAVRPRVLAFNSTTKKLSFKVTLSSTRKTIGYYYFGSLSWIDGKHVVRIPISVKTEIIPSYVDSA